MKKKLLFINGHLQSGGVEKSLLDILTHLDYRRYEVDLLLLEAWAEFGGDVWASAALLIAVHRPKRLVQPENAPDFSADAPFWTKEDLSCPKAADG